MYSFAQTGVREHDRIVPRQPAIWPDTFRKSLPRLDDVTRFIGYRVFQSSQLLLTA